MKETAKDEAMSQAHDLWGRLKEVLQGSTWARSRSASHRPSAP
ncbi:hypothetical protein [Kocuria marina]